MTSASLKDIYTNIYGEESTQSFANVIINNIQHHSSGGSRPIGSVLYLDEQPIRYNHQIVGGSKSNKTTFGGNDFDGTIYSDPLNVAKSDKFPIVEKFMKECFLDYLFVNIFPDGIVIVPEKKDIEEMGKEIEDAFKKEDIKKHTEEAKKLLSTHAFSFKNYLLTMKDRKNTDNDGYIYSVPSSYPEKTSTDIVRRLTMAGQIYYFTFGSSIKVSATPDMKNSSALKFLAKCSKNVYVLQGELPKAVEKIKREKEAVSNLSGGNSKANYKNKVKYLRNLIRKNGNDPDSAAYDFIGHTVLSGKECDDCDIVKKIAKKYSGDFISSAFEVVFDDSILCPLEMVYDNEEVNETHNELVKAYTPNNTKVNINKGREIIQRIFNDARSSSSGLESNKKFINQLSSLYKRNTIDTSNSFKVDVAAAVLKRGNSARSFEEAIHIAESIDYYDEDEDSFVNASMSNGDNTNTTILMQSIYNNLYSTPFISLVAKENVPLLHSYTRSSKKTKTKKEEEEPEKGEISDMEYLDMFI